MEKLSFMDKLKVLIDVSASSKLFILVIAFFFFLGIVFYTTNSKNKNTTAKMYIACILFVVIFLLVSYYKSIGNMIDYLMNNIFILIYFPNLAVYLVALLITNIILLISLFNYKVSKLIKNINITIYCILNYILALILNLVSKYNLDVFKTESVYKNKNAQALIELSSVIFIVWILFLIIYRLIMIYLKKEYKPPVRKVIIRKKERILPDYINETTIPNIVREVKKVEEPVIKPVIEPVFKEEKPVIVPLTKEEKILEQLDKMLTIDDYKILLKLLKEKQLKEKRKPKNNNSYKELQDLYKSVR